MKNNCQWVLIILWVLFTSPAKASSQDEFKIRVYEDIPVNDGARRHYETLREMQATYYRVNSMTDKTIYDPFSDEEIVFHRSNALQASFGKMQERTYSQRLATRVGQEIPFLGLLVEEGGSVPESSNMKQFDEVMDLDVKLRNKDSVYRELSQKSETENLGYSANDDHSRSTAVMLYRQSKSSQQPEKEFERNMPVSSGPASSQSVTPEMDYNEAMLYLRSSTYVVALLGNEELAVQLQQMLDVYTAAYELNMLMQGGAEVSSGAVFAGWVGFAVALAKVMTDKEKAKGEQKAIKIILDAIQRLANQMHNRFDRLEEMMHSMGIDIIKIKMDQDYLIRSVEELSYKVANLEAEIRKESEITKSDELFDAELMCMNAVRSKIRNSDTIKLLNQCLKDFSAKLDHGIHGLRLNVYPTNILNQSDLKFDDIVELVNKNNPYGQLNLFSYVLRVFANKSNMSEVSYPNVAYFYRYAKIFDEIYNVVGSNLLDYETMVVPLLKKKAGLEKTLKYVQTDFIKNYAKLLAQHLTPNESDVLNGLLIQMQHTEGVSLLGSSANTIFESSSDLLKNVSSASKISDLIDSLLAHKKEVESAKSRLQNIEKMKIGVKLPKDWRDVLRTNFQLLADSFQSAILDWFPNLQKDNNLVLMGIMNTDFISEQRLHFRIVPKNALANRKAIDFIVSAPHLIPRGKMIASRPDLVKAEIQKSIKNSRSKNIQIIYNAILASKISVLEQSIQVLQGESRSLAAQDQNLLRSAIQRRIQYFASLHKIVYHYDKDLFYCSEYQSIYQRSMEPKMQVYLKVELYKSMTACYKKRKDEKEKTEKFFEKIIQQIKRISIPGFNFLFDPGVLLPTQ